MREEKRKRKRKEKRKQVIKRTRIKLSEEEYKRLAKEYSKIELEFEQATGKPLLQAKLFKKAARLEAKLEIYRKVMGGMLGEEIKRQHNKEKTEDTTKIDQDSRNESQNSISL